MGEGVGGERQESQRGGAEGKKGRGGESFFGSVFFQNWDYLPPLKDSFWKNLSEGLMAPEGEGNRNCLTQ